MRRRGLRRLDEAESSEELERRYDERAPTYDSDLEASGYKLPALIGELLVKRVDNLKAHILDAGAGTGLSGEYLKQGGYKNLHAIDISRGMLAEAKRKKIYRKLEQMALGEELSFPNDYFDAILSVDTIGQAPPESFDELIRVTKSLGLIVFSLRADFYKQPRFSRKLKALEKAGKWRLIEKTAPLLTLSGQSPEVYSYGFVYEVLSGTVPVTKSRPRRSFKLAWGISP